MSSQTLTTAAHNGPAANGNPNSTKPVEVATNETVDPKFRKKKLVPKQHGPRKIKYIFWITGHVLSVVFGVVTFVWQCFWLKNVYYINSISYRMSLIGALIAFLATFSKRFGLHYLPPFLALMALRNFQYFILSVVWCFTFKSVFKIIPTFLISLLQLAQMSKFSLVLKQAEFLAAVIAFDELFLVAFLLLRTLLFRYTSGFQLTLVLVFLWLRVLFDEDLANLFGYVVGKLDGKMSQSKNPKVTKIWGKIKRFLAEKQNPGLYQGDESSDDDDDDMLSEGSVH